MNLTPQQQQSLSETYRFILTLSTNKKRAANRGSSEGNTQLTATVSKSSRDDMNTKMED